MSLKNFLNIRSLRLSAKELNVEQLKSISEKLNIIIAEKEEEIRLEELKRSKRLENVNKYKEMLAQDGLSIDELAELLSGKTSKTQKTLSPRPAKYKFVDENGNEKTWTGQGRTPKALQQLLDAGKKLEDFTI